MKTTRFFTFCILLALIMLYAIPAHADRGKRWPEANKWRQEKPRYDMVDKRGYRLDSRHRHNRYYPRRGEVIQVLPRGYRTIPYRSDRYYFYSGIWYRPYQNRFIVSLPPVGMTLSYLPEYYTTIWVGGLPYYYADGVYYRWLPRDRVYVVTEAPKDTEIVEQPEIPDQLFVYPKAGQSEQVQADDRYECHRWSADQTGFDPTLPNGNVPENLYDSKKADYQRAMKACLEARDYSVQ
jgi:hypothetical protein